MRARKGNESALLPLDSGVQRTRSALLSVESRSARFELARAREIYLLRCLLSVSLGVLIPLSALRVQLRGSRECVPHCDVPLSSLLLLLLLLLSRVPVTIERDSCQTTVSVYSRIPASDLFTNNVLSRARDYRTYNAPRRQIPGPPASIGYFSQRPAA